MTDRKVYEVTAEREGSWWILRIPELDAVTQARRLDLAQPMVKDLIYALTDEDPASFDVAIRAGLAPTLQTVVRKATVASHEAKRQQDAASTATRQAVRALEAAGLTTRDIGGFLGISHQRVAQLLRDDSVYAGGEREQVEEPGPYVSPRSS